MNWITRTQVIIVFFISSFFSLTAQVSYKPQDPQSYTIGGIEVQGNKFLQPIPIIKASGLFVGQKITIPGPEISAVIDKIWSQGFFSDVQIHTKKISGDSIFLVLHIKEVARLSSVTYEGIKKSQKNDIVELVSFQTQTQITENKKNNAFKKIKDYYNEKGYCNASIIIEQIEDTAAFNQASLVIKIDKKNRVKIQDIQFSGNNAISTFKLQRAMKNTKMRVWYVIKKSKFIPTKYEEDKQSIIEKYKKIGYRDVTIESDTVYDTETDSKIIKMVINEGPKYYFRNISWIGNTKYSSDILYKMLNINKGEVYNEALFQEQMFGMTGVSSLYLDNGYLFFNAEPHELQISGDSVDIEIRIYEGAQAVVNNIIVKGNSKTNDHVIYRQIRTKPGDLFSRADIIRTQRELAMLGYFDAETMQINPKPNPQNGTVDIEYILEEKSTDQIEVSGGYSGQYFIGSVKLSLNNISLKNMINPKAWQPIPSGDGQKLNLSASVNPRYYQLYSLSFTEPWLGGKKPNSLSYSVFYSIRGNGYERSDTASYGSWSTIGMSVGLGQNLKKPDDFFTLYNEIGLKQYTLNNYDNSLYATGLPKELPKDIVTKTFNWTANFGRNSIDQPLYPRRGSMFNLKLEITPPFSMINKYADEASLTPEERYSWIEYHKWTFTSKLYTQLIDKLVLETRINFGFLGYYNENFKSPFERFDVGGDGLSNMSYYGVDIVPLRGYTSSSITPYNETGANLYNKYSLELRYPLTLKPQATIYGLVFAEAANAWVNFNDFNPFALKKSAGLGIRLFLPMLGLIGFDFGYGFDNIPGKIGVNKWQPSFVLGQQF